MMSEPQPEYVWAHSDERPKRGRVWLIVLLAIVAVAIAAVAFWLFLRPGAPGADRAPTASAMPTHSPSPRPTPTPTMTTEPAPVETPPMPPNPDLATFREQVRPWLDDALTGLGFLTDSPADEAESIVDSLRGDAQRLADSQVPASISAEWRDHLTAYSQQLEALETAVSSGADSAGAVESARRSVESLRTIADL